MRPFYLVIFFAGLFTFVNSGPIRRAPPPPSDDSTPAPVPEAESVEVSSTELVVYVDNATLSSVSPFPTKPGETAYDANGKIICDSSDMLDHRTSAPPRLLVLALVAVLLVIKTIAKVHPNVTKVLPESALFVLFGLFTGIPIGMYYPTTFNPDHFFEFLLPVIVLEASFSVSNSDLMENAFKISVFAIVGTILNTIFIAAALIATSGYFIFAVGSGQLILFSTILSAVDPVAVISVFEDVGVNALLYVNVFGESLLNDGVTVVLFRAIQNINSTGNGYSFFVVLLTVVDFFRSAIGGCILGLVGALVTGFSSRLTLGLSIVQPIYVIFIPYTIYLVAEHFHFSGIIALMFCVILMKAYTKINLSAESTAMTEFLLKSGSSVSESYIFMYLGICTYQVIWAADIYFCGILIVACFVARFVETFLLCALLNLFEFQKLRLVDQFVMAYSGLRGAVCYGLVMSLDATAYPCKKYFASAAIVIVLTTIFIQGATIKWIVLAMRVKLADTREDTRFEITTKQVMSHLMGAVSATSGRPFMNRYIHHIMEFHDKHLARYLMHCDPQGGVPNKSAFKITAKHEELEKEEAFERFRKCGSFAVMPSSVDDAVIRKSQSMVQPPPSNFFQLISHEPLIEEEPEQLTINMGKKTLPRNMSDRKLLNAIFHDQNTVQKNMYSRYFTGARPSLLHAFDEDNEEDEAREFAENGVTSQARYNTIPNYRCRVPNDLASNPGPSRARTTKRPQKSDRPNSPLAKPPSGGQPSRPFFVMGNDDDHITETTHTTGRFRVTTKLSPSQSAASHEVDALLKDKEEI